MIGETAGILKSTKLVTSVPEFIAGLPAGHRLRVDRLHAARLRRRPGPGRRRRPTRWPSASARSRHTIWITETGVGPAPKEYSGIVDPSTGCRALHDRLVQWFDDPRVTVAFQYTVREDDKFPTGLYSTDLTTPRPALAEWIAWGGGRAPTAPPPPPAC